MKVCTTCGKQKPLKDFNMNGEKKRAQCKVCQALKSEEIRQRNKKEVALYITSLKSDGCSICGKEFRPYCLDFHHIDPAKKKYAPSLICQGHYKLKVVKKELEKCIVVCANCHRHIHFG